MVLVGLRAFPYSSAGLRKRFTPARSRQSARSEPLYLKYATVLDCGDGPTIRRANGRLPDEAPYIALRLRKAKRSQ